MVTASYQGKWMGTAAKDMFGRELQVGDKVARAVTADRAANLNVSEVTRVEDGKVYLDNSKVPLVYPGRLLIVNEVTQALGV